MLCDIAFLHRGQIPSSGRSGRILQHLEREGYISREGVQQDGRLKSLVPTEKGTRLDDQVHACLQQTEQEMIAGISPGQIQMFIEIVSKMSSNLSG